MPDQDLPNVDNVRDVMGKPSRRTEQDAAPVSDSKTIKVTGTTTVVAANVTLSSPSTKTGKSNDDTNSRILDTLKSIYGEISRPPQGPAAQLQNKIMQRMYPGVTAAAKKGKLTVAELLTSRPDPQYTQGYEPSEVMELTRLMTVNNFNTNKLSMQDPRSSGRIATRKAAYVGEMLKTMSVGQKVLGTRDFGEQIEIMNQLRMGNDRADGSIYKTPPKQLQERLYTIETLARKSKAPPDAIVSGLLQSQRYIDATSGRLTDPLTGKRETPNSFATSMQIEEMTRRIAKAAGRSDEPFINRTRNRQVDLVTRASQSRVGSEAGMMEYRHQMGMASREEYAEYKRIAASGDQYALTEYATKATGMSSSQLRRVREQVQSKLDPEHLRSMNVSGRMQQATRLTDRDLIQKQIIAEREWDAGQKILADAGIKTTTYKEQKALIAKKVADPKSGERSAISSGVENAIMTGIPNLGAGERVELLRRYQEKEKKVGPQAARDWAKKDVLLGRYTNDFNAAIDTAENRQMAKYNDRDPSGQKDATRQAGMAKAKSWVETQKGRIFDIHNIPLTGATEAGIISGVDWTDRLKQVGYAGKAATAIVGLDWFTKTGRKEIGENLLKMQAIPMRAAEAARHPEKRLAGTIQAIKDLGAAEGVDPKVLEKANARAAAALNSGDKKEIIKAHDNLIKVAQGNVTGKAGREYADRLKAATQLGQDKLSQADALRGGATLTENELGWFGRLGRKLTGGNKLEQAKIQEMERNAVSSSRHGLALETNEELKNFKENQKPKTLLGRLFSKDTAEDKGSTGKPSTLTGTLTVIEGNKTYSATLDGNFKE